MPKVRYKTDVRGSEGIGSAILNSLRVGVVTVDRKGRILGMTGAASRILGVPDVPPRGRNYRGVIPPGSVAREVISKTLREGRGVPETIGPASGENEERRIRCVTSLIRDRAGKPRAVVVEIHDITLLARMEEEVRRLDRLATVGRFASALAHEIRNPLTGIYAGVQFLERSLPPENEQQEITYRIVREEVERLNRIVGDMLGTTKPPEPDRKVTDPNEITQHVALLLEEEGRRREVKVTYRADATLPRIRLDPDLMTQVLLNLGRNAIQASPAGGEVTLEATVSTGTPAYGMLPHTGSTPGVEFHVRDQGPGIAPSDQARLFEPFQTGRKDGTGLGLYISYQIMEAHAGALWAKTGKGGGAEFIAWIPYRTGSREEGADRHVRG